MLPSDWKARPVSSKIYFQPKTAEEANIYVEKYSGSLTAGTTELKNRLTGQLGNACGGPEYNVSQSTVNKFGTTANKVTMTLKTKDCQDGMIVSSKSETITETAYAVSSAKGVLLIWQQYSTSNSDVAKLSSVSNSLIDSINVQ